MVIIAPNYPAGRDHLNGFKRLYEGEVIDELYTQMGQIDYAPEIAQIRSLSPMPCFSFCRAPWALTLSNNICPADCRRRHLLRLVFPLIRMSLVQSAKAWRGS